MKSEEVATAPTSATATVPGSFAAGPTPAHEADSVAELDKIAAALPRYIRTLYPNRYTKQLRQRIVNLNIERLPNEWSVHYSTDHVTYTLVLAVAPTLSEAILKMHNIVQKNGLNSEEWIVDLKAIPWE